MPKSEDQEALSDDPGSVGSPPSPPVTGFDGDDEDELEMRQEEE